VHVATVAFDDGARGLTESRPQVNILDEMFDRADVA
jgi:hypothetical protein